jgi:hypothetical protein
LGLGFAGLAGRIVKAWVGKTIELSHFETHLKSSDAVKLEMTIYDV